jgi:adenylate cyclase
MTATRRLAAILAADVAGYSRLMGADEEGTLERLKALRRELIDPRIAAHRGRIVKTTGDGVLLEFASVVDAVRCAVEMQQAMAGREADSAPERRIQFRVGINLGDVIVDGDDIHGDGVNVAARLEAMAEPGAVYVSGAAWEQVRGKLPFDADDLGARQLKNIEQPRRVFRIASGRSVVTETTAKPSSLPDKPSIAVLPFTNISGDPEQDYFADGIVEDIITSLSRIRWLFVIARNSSFTYKGRAVDVKQVGRELGVRYVLEGSVRKAGSRVRVTGQLIEAATGTHIWADRYDRDYSDIFALQDDITASVISVLAPKLRTAEIERARRKRPESLDAYDLFLRALPHYYAMTREGHEEALRLLRQALALDEGFAAATSLAAECYVYRVGQGWASVGEDAGSEAVRLARRAISLDPDDAEALAIAGCALGFTGEDLDGAVEMVDRAAAIDPNSSFVSYQRGYTYIFAGRCEAAIPIFEEGLKLNPTDPMSYASCAGLALALSLTGRAEEAIPLASKAMRQSPLFAMGIRILAVALAAAGREDEAAAAIRRMLELDPGLTVSKFVAHRGWHERTLSPMVVLLRKAGLPE